MLYKVLIVAVLIICSVANGGSDNYGDGYGTEKPVTTKEYVPDTTKATTTTKKPATTKPYVPETTKATTTTKKPATTKPYVPETTKATTTTKKPATTKATTTTYKPATTKATTTTKKPATTKPYVPETTKATTTTKKPATTKPYVPDTTKATTTTKKPDTTVISYPEETEVTYECDEDLALENCQEIGCECCGMHGSENYNKWLKECKRKMCRWNKKCEKYGIYDFKECMNEKHKIEDKYDRVCNKYCKEPETTKYESIETTKATTTTEKPYVPETTVKETTTTTTEKPYVPETTTTEKPYVPETTTTEKPYTPPETTHSSYRRRRRV